MAEYLIGYFGGGQPSSPEEGQKHRQAWMAWIESLGDKVVNSGQPLMKTEQLGPGIETAMMGFAVVRADSIDEAREIAEADPFLKMGGTIQLSEMMAMPG